jgi:DNA polymerase IV (DinB-like DNA polymerase)
VAKIAAGRQKPDGLTVVESHDVQRFLAPLSVREIVGVGRKTEALLKKLGIRTIDQLASFDINEMILVFGKNLGSYFHNAALGIDKSPVKQRSRADSVSRIITLKENTRDLPVLMATIDTLAEDVHSKVTEQELAFKSVSITTIMEDLTMLSRSKTFQSQITNLEITKKTANTLLKSLLEEHTESSVRRIGVKLSGFTIEKGQKQLFEF